MASELSVLGHAAPRRGHRTLAEKAFETLHAAIVTGRLSPGARLPIEELAQLLHMSPMPIREALRRLDAAGLVEHVPHRGARVSELSLADLADVTEARLALETRAIRRAAQRFTKERDQATRQRLRDLDDISDNSSAAAFAAHAAFHFTLYEAADSVWLLRLIRPVWENSERYCLAVPECRQVHEREAEHEAIIDACAAGDPDRAAAALADHIVTTADNIALAMGGEPLHALRSQACATVTPEH